MNKKILMIAGGILGVIIIIVAFILFLNGRNNKAAQNQAIDQTDTSTTTDTSTATDNNSSSKLKKLSDSSVIAPALGYDDKAAWFFTADGHLFEVNLTTGLKQEFLLPSTVNISDAIWPPLGNDFIIISGDSPKTFYYYDSALKNGVQQKFLTFPTSVKNIDFLEDGKRIAYIWADNKGADLEIGDHELKAYEVIAPVASKDDVLKVSSLGDRALLYNPVNDGKFYLVLFQNKKTYEIKTSSENMAIWSGDGKHFLYNNDSGSQKNNELWIGNSDKVEDRDTKISTSVSKAAFDKEGNNLYVAVKDGDSDTFWKVNTATLSKTKVFDAADAGDLAINASNLFVSSDGGTLFFKNSDGFLYSIDLP